MFFMFIGSPYGMVSKEHIDTSTPTGKFMLTVFGAIAELERYMTLQRQAEGIRAAKSRGVQFGRPVKKSPENFIELELLATLTLKYLGEVLFLLVSIMLPAMKLISAQKFLRFVTIHRGFL